MCVYTLMDAREARNVRLKKLFNFYFLYTLHIFWSNSFSALLYIAHIWSNEAFNFCYRMGKYVCTTFGLS